MNLPKEKRDRLILVCIGGAAIAIGIWYGLIRSGSARLSKSDEKRAFAKERVEKAKRAIGQAEKVESETEAAVQALRGIETDMASGVDLYRWSLLLMEKARGGHEIEIAEVTRPQTNEIGLLANFPYSAATFTVRGSAYYHNFGRFLADFENRFPYFRVQNLSLGTLAEAGGDPAASRAARDQLLFKMDIVVPIKPSP